VDPNPLESAKRLRMEAHWIALSRDYRSAEACAAVASRGGERTRDYSKEVSKSSSPLAPPPLLLFLIKKIAATAPPAPPPIGTRNSGKVVSCCTKLSLAFAACADGGGVATWTVKLRVFVRNPPVGATTAVMRTDPLFVGWKIAIDEPSLSVVSLTVGVPEGTAAVVDRVDFVEVLEAVEVLVVVLFVEFVT